MEFEIVTVTPDLARQWLATMGTNRSVSRSTVNRYAADMRAGRWRLTKEAISFDERGRLDDGQHRLLAQIEADVNVTFAVIRDAPNDQFEVLDSGRPRTLGSVFTMEGVTNGSHVVAAVRTVLRYQLFPDTVWSGTSANITNMQILDYYNAFGMSDEGLSQARQYHVLTPSTWLSLQHIITTSAPSADRWPEFAEATLLGVNLPLGDARLALRNWQQGLRWGNGQSHLLAGITAWNHWINRRNTQFIRAARGQLPMPKPQ